MDRITGLKEILAADPKNSLARYGLAMELVQSGDNDAALAEFDKLLNDNPGYTAAYQMAAHTLIAAGRKEEAAARLKSGIACASQSGNSHAASEMQGMLDELGG